MIDIFVYLFVCLSIYLASIDHSSASYKHDGGFSIKHLIAGTERNLVTLKYPKLYPSYTSLLKVLGSIGYLIVFAKLND